MDDTWLKAIEAAALALFTTSSVMIGAGLGLYFVIPRRLLAIILAFASGSLVCALAIDLGFEDALQMVRQGASVQSAWLTIAGGFAVGAIIYYVVALFLEQKGSALRYPSRFLEFALQRKRRDGAKVLELVSQSDLLRHLSPRDADALLAKTKRRAVKAGEIVFNAGDPGDAFFIIADGVMQVSQKNHVIAELHHGQTFGEMALLNEGPRTATVEAKTDGLLVVIAKDDFERLLSEDQVIAERIRKISHDRLLTNLETAELEPGMWLKMARESMGQLSRGEEYQILQKAAKGKGVGLAIVLGNILDTIPGALVIGSNFGSLESLPAPLILGMFIGGFPEAAASAAMLRRAGYDNRSVFGLWSSVLVAAMVFAIIGRVFINGSDSMAASLAQAVAGGAVLACVTHAMIPEAIHEGGSGIVLPTVAGFLFSLYFVLLQTQL